MQLSSNLYALRAAAGMNRAAVQRAVEGKIHLYSIGQIDTNRAGRYPLTSVARLCRVFGVGVAAPYPYPSEGATQGATDQPATWLWRWQEVNGELTLVWALNEILQARNITLNELYFATHEAQSALRHMAEGAYQQVGLDSLGVLCRELGCGIAPPPPGPAIVTTPPPTEYLFSWVVAREVIVTEHIRQEAPIPGEPSKICRGILCRQSPTGEVEKRLEAFPRSATLGRGPQCNRCRAESEKRRRNRKKEEAKKVQP